MGFEPKTWRTSAPRAALSRRGNRTRAQFFAVLPGREKVLCEKGVPAAHCEANTLPLSYTPTGTRKRAPLETQGFEPWTFCNIVCVSAAVTPLISNLAVRLCGVMRPTL